MHMKKNLTPHIAACIVALEKKANAIQIFPAGTFSAPNGALKGSGPWNLTPKTAAALIATVMQRDNDILIDYEHQSLQAASNGKPSPAAGWVKPNSFIWNELGLFAQNPIWTESAAAMIAADEYRYLSPVFTYNPETGVPLNILSIALTNTPAIDGMAAVSIAAAMTNILNTPQESTMDIDELLERLRYFLNLPTLSTPADMKVELEKLITLLGIDATTTAAASITAKNTQIAALTQQQPNPADFVPISVMSSMQVELAALKAGINSDRVTSIVTAALSVGKLLPAQEAWAMGLGKNDLSALTAYLETVSPIAALSGNQTGGKGNSHAGDNSGDINSIIAAATAYRYTQQQAGVQISVSEAVSHIMKKD